MNVGAGGNTGNGAAKREEWYSLSLQIADQCPAFCTVWMQSYVNCVTVIVTEPVVSS